MKAIKNTRNIFLKSLIYAGLVITIIGFRIVWQKSYRKQESTPSVDSIIAPVKPREKEPPQKEEWMKETSR